MYFKKFISNKYFKIGFKKINKDKVSSSVLPSKRDFSKRDHIQHWTCMVVMLVPAQIALEWPGAAV